MMERITKPAGGNVRRQSTAAALVTAAAAALLVSRHSANAALIASNFKSSAPVATIMSGGSVPISPLAVIPGDTFSVALVGYNGTTSTASGAYLTSPSVFDPVFGTTNSYAGDALGGQTLTITSNEVVGPTTTTDTITLSVPTNFAPTGTTIGGRYIDQIQLDIGGYNAVPADTLDFADAPIAPVGTGYITYSGGNFALGPSVTAENGGYSYEAAEGVTSGTGATQASSLEPLNVNVISFSLTYTNLVPEPASLSAAAIAGLGLLARRRRLLPQSAR